MQVHSQVSLHLVSSRCGVDALCGDHHSPIQGPCGLTVTLRLHIWTHPGLCKCRVTAMQEETRAYIRPQTTRRYPIFSGPDGICASSPKSGLRPQKGPTTEKGLKKQVSPFSPSCSAQASRQKRPLNPNHESGQAAGRYTSSWAISDQRMRAFLLANATQARVVPSRCCLSWIQRLR